MATLAGLLALANAAIAVDPDATIVISRSINSPTFSVKYSGASVALAELRVNGESVTTRNLNSSVTSGETNFNISLSSLIDGENEIEVRLFDRSGKLVGTQKSVVNQDSTDKPAIYLTTPKLGATVQGPVEIKVGFGQKFKDSYVSFFIDNQFRTMSNVAPFNYVWDTGRENNGWHELEAWVVNGGSDTLKSKKVRVFVDNPGGHTSRRFVASTAKPVSAPAAPKDGDLITMGTIVPGMTIANSAVKIVPANPSPAVTLPTALPLTLLATSLPAKTAAASTVKLSSTPVAATVASTGLRHMTPTGKRLADRSATPAEKVTKVPQPKRATIAPAAKAVVEIKSSTQPQGRVALPGSPVVGMSVTHIRPLTATADLTPVATGVAATPPAATALKATPVVQPHPSRIETPGATSSVAVAKTVAAANAAPTAKALIKAGAVHAKPVHKSSTVTTLVKIEPGVRIASKGSFAIIMDGDIVEFDVQPRIDNGVPMTPFRHLIEKKGGEVNWEAKTKEVNAKAEGKAIYLQIGTRVARIDQKAVNLELAPYLEGGRTIVPLSFIRETLKVNVDYDKATGHVLITTIK